MKLDPHPLPEARLRPQTGADHKAILRGQAATGARTAGRFAWALTKVVALIAVIGLAGAALGSVRSRNRAPDFKSESVRRLEESLRRIQTMPKFDFSKLDLELRRPHTPSFDRDRPSLESLEIEHDLSPSPQRATTWSP